MPQITGLLAVRPEQPLLRPVSGARAVRVALAFTVVLALALRVAHFRAIAGTAFPQVQLAIPGADTGAHWAWSGEILAGDWLGRSTFHQITDWMLAIAPVETWHRWWGGEQVFHREPLYPYFLALVRWLSGKESVLAVLGVQLAIGALRPLVLFALGRRLGGPRAGLLAAAFGAVHGPTIFFESSLLRDWIPSLLDPLLLVAFLRARERGVGLDWALAGLLFGAGVLARSSLLLFLPLVLGWIVLDAPRRRAARLRAGGLVLAGLGLALVPLVARNIAVGAPAFALTNRAAETIVEANAADAVPVGMPIPASLPSVLEKARGSALRASIEVVRGYEGDWRLLVRRQWLKLWGAFDTREHTDNLDYEYGRSLSPVLRFAPGFALAGLFGLAGLFLFLRRGGAHALVLLYVLSVLGSLMLTVVVGRYRLGMTAVLAASGAAYAVSCWTACARAASRGRSPRWRCSPRCSSPTSRCSPGSCAIPRSSPAVGRSNPSSPCTRTSRRAVSRRLWRKRNVSAHARRTAPAARPKRGTWRG